MFRGLSFIIGFQADRRTSVCGIFSLSISFTGCSFKINGERSSDFSRFSFSGSIFAKTIVPFSDKQHMKILAHDESFSIDPYFSLSCACLREDWGLELVLRFALASELQSPTRTFFFFFLLFHFLPYNSLRIRHRSRFKSVGNDDGEGTIESDLGLEA